VRNRKNKKKKKGPAKSSVKSKSLSKSEDAYRAEEERFLREGPLELPPDKTRLIEPADDRKQAKDEKDYGDKLRDLLGYRTKSTVERP
jgi:hypothetical protein